MPRRIFEIERGAMGRRIVPSVLAIGLVVGLMHFSPRSLAQTKSPGADKPASNLKIIHEKLKADKKLIVAENLKLTDAEGTAFWPVYEAYQKDLAQINQRLAATVKAYADAYNKGPVANDMAKKLLDEAVAIDEAEAKLKTP